MMTIDDVNALNDSEFVATFGFLFEHSPWVVEDAVEFRPFKTPKDMHASLMTALYDGYGPGQEPIDVVRAHPKLADKVAIAQGLTRESASEQASAGLDALTPEEFEQFRVLNAAYEARFGFPFVVCVRLVGDKSDILAALQSRLKNDGADELSTALKEVDKIVWLRLQDVVTP